ncbi:MAG: hypothetical protein ABSC13_09070 [Dehalococcoidia bacterium]|jgi:polyhydroxyalkanoate synthesis regulator phasin
MKPKNPSGDDGGRGKRVSGNPQAKPHRRGTPLPNVLARLLGAVLGVPSKPAKRPSAEKPPRAETVATQEVEESMPENLTPQEGPEEIPHVEEIAGSEESKETPATPTQANEATRRAADILAKALSEAEAVLIKAVPEATPDVEPAVEPMAWVAPEPVVAEQPPPPPKPDPLEETREVLRILADHFDHALDRMADERRIVIDEVQSSARLAREQTDRELGRVEQDRRLLTEHVAALTAALERLERRLDDLSHFMLASRPSATIPVEEEEKEPEESEPAFIPGDQGLILVISSVPGFQGLMEVQRALSRVPAIEGASVERYFDGEARIVLMLREPITAEHLLETLSQATGQQLQLEESRPESMRMRVRFRGSGG